MKRNSNHIGLGQLSQQPSIILESMTETAILQTSNESKHNSDYQSQVTQMNQQSSKIQMHMLDIVIHYLR